MRRWLAIAGLALGLLTVPVRAQRRGGMSGGSAGRGGFVARGMVSSGRGSFVGAPRAGVRVGAGFRPPGFFPNRFGPNRFGPNRFFHGYPLGYFGGYYGYPLFSAYPGFYADYPYPATVDSYPGYSTSASYFDPNEQFEQSEVERLENEVDELRAERAERAAGSTASGEAPRRETEPQPTTVLVFRDQHTEEVGNYAIVGPTLWIFTEQQARKVPIASLDLAATKKANDERGVDFRLPE
jgi:hypothetical protein